MDQAKRTAYVKIINALFDGAVKVQPSQITETVVDMVDKMFDEIATCHERIRPMAVLADGIAGSIVKLAPNEIPLIFGNSSFGSYLKSKTRDEVFKVLKQSKVNNAGKVLEAFYESWLKYTAKDRRLKVCIVTAQSRWSSRFEMELLGI
ncbi:TPA: hypothetical protein ACTC36_000257 [Neisseria meningitidis]|uniref:hypothetical protein n=1 Tax=Neisseria meningitidis TaxID=487 RepID=UPI0030B3513C